MDLNIITLIFFFLTILVFIQLRNVLGKRTGNERPHFNPYDKKIIIDQENENYNKSFNNKNSKDDAIAEINKLAPINSDLNIELNKILNVDYSFSPSFFCKGVKSAYEIIMIAFYEGNRNQLKYLLSHNIYKDFDRVIKEREEKQYSIKFSFISIKKVKILSANLQYDVASIYISISSDIILSIFDKYGKLIEGHPTDIISICDYWNFSRKINSKDPNWKLTFTGIDGN